MITSSTLSKKRFLKASDSSSPQERYSSATLIATCTTACTALISNKEAYLLRSFPGSDTKKELLKTKRDSRIARLKMNKQPIREKLEVYLTAVD